MISIDKKSILSGIQDVSYSSVWLSGSLIENLGNSSSDIDVFVAIKNRPKSTNFFTKRNRNFDIKILFNNGIRIDYEFWTEEYINKMASHLNRIPINDINQNILGYIDSNDSDFIHRIKVGEPIYGKNHFMELKSLFSFQLYQKYLINNYTLYVDDAFDDSVGMLKNGDLNAAVLRSRYTVEMSVDVLLYYYGNTNDKAKYRIIKLEKLKKVNSFFFSVYERFWNIQSIPKSEYLKIEYVKNSLRFSSEIIEYVQSNQL